jgi:endoglucanase
MRRGKASVAAALAALAASALGPTAAPAQAAGRALIRVNQVGYPNAAPKRAYLMTNRDASGASFSVLRSTDGTVAFSGTVGASLGSWSARFRHVYGLDFDALQTPGTYTISLGGRARAVSPPFAIASAGALNEGPLANGLSFYQNERDGPAFIPSALRSAPGHLNDQQASAYQTPIVNEEGGFEGDLTSLGHIVDASGGWWDAGDYLKFVQTTSYAGDVQLIGVRDFPAQMGASAGRSNFTEEARFGLEWLLRMWDDSTRTLYYQVGIGAGNSSTLSDHDIWRLPQADDTYGGSDPSFRYIRHRPVFRAGPPGSLVSPNLAGRDAAAFALCFEVFAHTIPELAARCLQAGEHIFELADTNPQGNLLTAIPFGFYPETEWRDDLELGATELAIALASGAPLPKGLPHEQSLYYLERAASWAKEYISHTGASGDPLNLYDVSALAHFELVRALRAGGSPSNLAVSQAQLIANLRQQLEAAVAQSLSDPFGFGFPWATADTASHGDGLSVMASEYEYLTGEATYRPFAARWLGNVLGANAWGSSFIIGDGATFPHCPQHQVANIVGSLDGSPPVLAGAVVEGPNEEASKGKLGGMRRCPTSRANTLARFNNGAVYKDNVESFTTNEPAIDLTASSLLAFSWQTSAARPLAPAVAARLGSWPFSALTSPYAPARSRGSCAPPCARSR